MKKNVIRKTISVLTNHFWTVQHLLCSFGLLERTNLHYIISWNTKCVSGLLLSYQVENFQYLPLNLEDNVLSYTMISNWSSKHKLNECFTYFWQYRKCTNIYIMELLGVISRINGQILDPRSPCMHFHADSKYPSLSQIVLLSAAVVIHKRMLTISILCKAGFYSISCNLFKNFKYGNENLKLIFPQQIWSELVISV